MKPLSESSVRGSRGSALLLVIALLLLLTTLTVAFLSRAMFERQLSNASYSQGKVDIAGQGAIAAIIGDLQKEIVAGSNAGAGSAIPAVASGYYYPTAPATTVPAMVVPGLTPSSISGTGMENLLKISCPLAFYSGSNYSTTGPNRSSSVPTTAASINNRSITAARWNKPLLLATTDTVSYTPSSSNFTAPYWIYIAKDGSNPTGSTLDSSYVFSPSVVPTVTPAAGSIGTNAITQRYAYAIYDEGSTLDMNVAGCPTTTGSLTYSPLQPYKSTLAYADLTQLPGITSLSAANKAAFVDAIVGWRNYSSAYSGNTASADNNTFPNTFNLGGTSPYAPFDQNNLFNPTGFMTAGNPSLYHYNSTTFNPVSALRLGPNHQGSYTNQGDSAFASRQQLLQFMLVGLGQNTTFAAKVPLANLVNVMPYLGTFSRDINQPSYGPSPTRPTIVGPYTSGGNDGSGGDTTINPPFLSSNLIVGTGGWTRNDGSIAVAGEPLVKKRFALNRLAWITYQGPSANRANVANPSSTVNTGTYTTPPNPDYDLYQLEYNYNIPVTFLQQGTATNIQNYFGLIWNSSGYWTYKPTSGASTSILTLSAVNSLGRDPNFVELLKAAILAGSIGKDFPTDISDTNQNNRYTSVDCSVLQIAANIIDQSTCDGYPTQIQLTNSSGVTYQIYGVKNLPYFYRVRAAALTTTLPTASSGTIYPNPSGYTPPTTKPWTGTISSPGQFTVIQEPEVWNPHCWNPSDSVTYGMGNPRPTQFYLSGSSSGNYTVTPLAAGTAYSGTSTPTPFSLTGTLSFQMAVSGPGSALYREPTLLIAPQTPAGSSLSSSAGTVNAYGAPYPYMSAGNVVANLYPSVFANMVSNPTAAQTNPWVGFNVGTGTLCWTGTTTGTVTLYIANQAQINGQGIVSTYSVSCAPPSGYSGNIAYDTKIGYTLCTTSSTGTSPAYTDYMAYPPGLGGDPRNNKPSSMLDMFFSSGTPYAMGGYLDTMIGTRQMYDVFDPRTGRFGIIDWNVASNNGTEAMSVPRYNTDGPSTRWASPQQNILESDRPDNYAGSGAAGSGAVDYTYPPNNADGWVWGTTANASQLYHGIFEQNNMNFKVYDNGCDNVPRYSAPNNGPYAEYYADPDGVVRRGSGGYVTWATPQSASSNAGSTASSPTSAFLSTPSGTVTVGLPMATAVGYATSAGTVVGTPITTGTATSATSPPGLNVSAGSVAADWEYFKSDAGVATPYYINPGTSFSRPIVLNRPFRTVGELGYVFAGTPWKNLDLMSQESGCTGLLDVFCINDTNDPGNLVAGKINLNTRQSATLQAVLGSAYIDNYGATFLGAGTFSPNINANGTLSSTVCSSLAQGLVTWTTGTATGQGPFVNIAELVGKWQAPSSAVKDANSNYDGTATTNYNGFSTYMTGLPTLGNNDYYINNIERFREAPMRALTAAATTRVWNLMIDVIAQTGRFPSTASTLTNFNVEGERRYWVHVAIDRFTGKILDEQVETVKE